MHTIYGLRYCLCMVFCRPASVFHQSPNTSYKHLLHLHNHFSKCIGCRSSFPSYMHILHVITFLLATFLIALHNKFNSFAMFLLPMHLNLYIISRYITAVYPASEMMKRRFLIINQCLPVSPHPSAL